MNVMKSKQGNFSSLVEKGNNDPLEEAVVVRMRGWAYLRAGAAKIEIEEERGDLFTVYKPTLVF